MFGGLELVPDLLVDRLGNVREDESAGEDEERAEGQPPGEGVCEVDDWEDQRQKLSKRQHQRHRQRRALRRQEKDGENADVLKNKFKKTY